MPETDLTIPGESAAITAAGTGIGRRVASALADAGLDVAINDLDEDALAAAAADLEASAGDVVTVPGDASDPDVAAGLVEASVDAFGGLDVLVNNVGIAGPTKPTEEIDHGEFMETLAVNLGATFAASKAAIPHLEDGGGRVVNLASIAGKRPLQNRTPYTTSKMGVIGFTRTLAFELADRGVTVNAICPGAVRGDRIDRVIDRQAESRGEPREAIEREFRDQAPMRTFVDPDDVADAALFLCSSRAARMTGQDLNVSGGAVMY